MLPALCCLLIEVSEGGATKLTPLTDGEIEPQKGKAMGLREWGTSLIPAPAPGAHGKEEGIELVLKSDSAKILRGFPLPSEYRTHFWFGLVCCLRAKELCSRQATLSALKIAFLGWPHPHGSLVTFYYSLSRGPSHPA